MLNIQSIFATINFNVMLVGSTLSGKLRIPVISTARPFSTYRKIFFNKRAENDVLKELAGKRIVDVGCGLTPFVEDSMFQVCRRNHIDFFGIDPKLATGFKFGLRDRINSLASGATSMPRADMPGQEKAIAAFADNLPFEDKSVDMILSNWLLFVWLPDEDLLIKIFSEFDRILKPGGEISFYPSMHWRNIEARYPQLIKRLAHYKKYQRFLFGAHFMSMPPAFVTRLVRSGE
jgi:SAM-dependent methyltransferase